MKTIPALCLSLFLILGAVVLDGSPKDDAWPQASPTGKSDHGAHGDNWIDQWLRAVDQARAGQPHFVSPIVTTHVMLVQQYRYDVAWQPGNTNYGSSRGIEIIPMTRLEVGLFPPTYVTHQSNMKDGFGDFSFQVKYRLFSATEGKGDYFVGLFLGGSVPTGSSLNGNGHGILSPTFALGKGLGPWDIQSTIGGNLPVSGVALLGRAVVFNTALDYRIKGKVWPMVEQNSTFWSGGALDGKKQTFITPGLVLGSFPIERRLRFTVGVGYQIAVTSFHQYNHRWILSLRFPF
jgi:hypothetical protein